MHLACARSHLNETIYAKNSVVHMVDGRACAKGIHIYLLSERHCHDNITTGVYDNRKKGIGVPLIVSIDWQRHAPLIELRNCGFSTSSW